MSFQAVCEMLCKDKLINPLLEDVFMLSNCKKMANIVFDTNRVQTNTNKHKYITLCVGYEDV